MAYTAPAKDTVHFVGGLGTQADKHADNGGGATKAAWDAGSPSDFIDTNGGPITSDTNCTYDHAGKLIQKAGIGTGVTVGTLAYVSGTNITTGNYEVTSVLDSNRIICSGIDSTDNNADTTCNVGGAFDLLQTAIDNDSTNAVAYNRTILTNLAETPGATIGVDTGGPSLGANFWKRYIGCDSSMVKRARGQYVTIDSSASAIATIEYSQKNSYTWGIHFTAQAGQSAILYGGVAAEEQGYNTIFENCIMDGGDIGVEDVGLHGKEGLVLVDCIVEGTAYGLDISYNIVCVGCVIRGGTVGVDIYITSESGTFYLCVFDGGTTGIRSDGDYALNVFNCLFYNQSGKGIEVSDSNALLVELNNIYIPADVEDGGTGVRRPGAGTGSIGYSNYSQGWDVAGNTDNKDDIWIRAANSYPGDNGGADSSIGDPLLVNAGSDDFRLQATSPCFHTGFPTIGSGTTSIGAWLRKQHPAKIKLDGT